MFLLSTADPPGDHPDLIVSAQTSTIETDILYQLISFLGLILPDERSTTVPLTGVFSLNDRHDMT